MFSQWTLTGTICVLLSFLLFQRTATVPKKKPFALLMTMHSDTQEKKEHYRKTVEQWLKNSTFDVYVVISSGEALDIEHDRLQQHVFQQSKVGKVEPHETSMLEKESILRARHAFLYEWYVHYHYIIKITGKYYVENLEDALSRISTKDFEKEPPLIVQAAQNTCNQNSELVGIPVRRITALLSRIDSTTSFECMLADFIENEKVIRLDPLLIKDRIPRRDSSVMAHL